jgi:two-component system, LuxR family, response regulator FixJ
VRDETPTVFVVDDDEAVCDSLELLLTSVGRRVETFLSARAFLDAYDPARPGCLVLDVRMPGISGLELQERLTALDADLPVLFVTAHGDVPMAVRALQAGAVDFLQKPYREQELLERIDAALAVDRRRRDRRARDARRDRCLDRLTPREREVLDHVVAGDANKVTAGALGISERTVEIHRGRMMRKMEAGSVAELVRLLLD